MDEKLSHTCKVCNTGFKTERSLHTHIKAHGVFLQDYYTTYYPRASLYNNKPIPFINKSQYFSTYFNSRDEMSAWLKNADKQEAQKILLDMLKNRIEGKELKYGPNHLELILSELPSIEDYKQFFGSYTEPCRRLGVSPLFNKSIKSKFLQENKNLKDITVLIDTREQMPLKFKNQKTQKLDFGDYTASREFYTKTYIDRKSETDFKSTMTVGFDRFRRELARAKQFNSFLYIVVESSIPKIINNNSMGAHESNLKFVWHQMRLLSHEFAGTCQFVFSGGRKRSENLIELLLNAGDELWGVDLQYYIDNRMLKI